MKKRAKRRILFLLILIIMFTSVGFLAAYRILNPAKKTVEPWIVPDANNSAIKFITQETIVNQIQQEQELIPFEVELNERVTIDNSWGNLDFFKKVQNVYFTGKGIYAVDMSKLYDKNVSMDIKKGTVTLTIPKPFIKAVVIDEKKTIYETTQNGLLRFGEVKVTPSEFQTMVNRAKGNMSEKLNSQELYDQALQATEIVVTKLVKNILAGDTGINYSVTIQFID